MEQKITYDDDIKQSCQSCKHNGKYDCTQQFPKFDKCNKCAMIFTQWEIHPELDNEMGQRDDGN